MRILARFSLSVLLGLFVLFFVVSPSFAMTLDSIGTSAVTSQSISQWYYTAENPTLSGIAAASSSVTITIDGGSNTATADASGNWSYVPTTLTIGDHTVSVAGDGQTVTFTLHVGQGVPSSSSSSTSAQTLPNSGSPLMTLVLLGMGGLLVIGGLKLRHIN